MEEGWGSVLYVVEKNSSYMIKFVFPIAVVCDRRVSKGLKGDPMVECSNPLDLVPELAPNVCKKC